MKEMLVDGPFLKYLLNEYSAPSLARMSDSRKIWMRGEHSSFFDHHYL